MELDDFLNRSLVLEKAWFIEGAEIVEEAQTVEIRVAYDGNEGPCPKCGRMSKRHDSNERRWRHLDMLDYQTWITYKVPRVRCEKHKVRRVDVPWADGWAGFTARFECSVIDWLK